MRIHSLARWSRKCCSSLIGILFSAWQATTHAWQPMQRSASTIMPQRCESAMGHLEHLLTGDLVRGHGALHLWQPDVLASAAHADARGGVSERAGRLVR